MTLAMALAAKTLQSTTRQSNAVGYCADGQYYADFNNTTDGTPVQGIKQRGRIGSSANTKIDAVEPLRHNDDADNSANYALPSSFTPRQLGFGLSFAKVHKAATGRTSCSCLAPRARKPLRNSPRARTVC